MADPQTLVRCFDITKYFGGVRALDRITLDFRASEIVCVVGDNGAGKSTLVKILSGVHPFDEGRLWIGAEEIHAASPRNARRLGVETIYQDLALCDNLGAADNVMLGQEPARRFRVGPIKLLNERRSRQLATELIARVGATLPDLATPVRRLSGGQRQAIAIARALVHAHRMIILDEPTAALGVRQTQATLDLVRRIADQDVAAIMISHNLDDVFAVADRIIVMRLGRIVLDRPADATSREEVVACMTGTSSRN